MEATTTEKSILKIDLNAKDYHNLLEGRTVYKHGENGTENICIFINPNDFPITRKTQFLKPDNFGILETKGDIYIIKVSACEFVEPNKTIIIGLFANQENCAYSKFEIDINLDD